MPATLERDGDILVLNLSGHPSFKEALARVKKLPGRNFDHDGSRGHKKCWLFPATLRSALAVMNTVQPQPDAEVLGWLRDHSAKIADQLSSQLPADVELHWTKGPELFDFQRPAVDFLARQERVLLGDDMGLGKTIEAIGAVQEWRERAAAELRGSAQRGGIPGVEAGDLQKPKLVVAATSKLGDWVDELNKWDPDHEAVVVPGDWTAPRRQRELEAFAKGPAREGGWLVVNHEQLRAEPPPNGDKSSAHDDWVAKQPWFAEQDWLARVLDEAHRFKSKDAQQTVGATKTRSRLTYLLTGTPIINHPGELWSLLHALFPDKYEEGSASKVTYWQFYFTYVESYPVSHGSKRGRVETGVKNAEELRFELGDKLVRRSKRMLIEKGLLPDKLPTKHRDIPMKPAQARLYHEAEDAMWLAVEQDIDEIRTKAHDGYTAAEGELKRAEAAAESGDVDALMRFLPNAAAKYAALRQIATSPALLGGKDESGKLDAIIEEILDHEGKPFVVYGWHRRTVELIVERLERRQVEAEFFHGDTGQLERTEVVRRFSDGDTQVLVPTIKTGGEGLNLVRADMALFAEQSDRVTDQDQAVDRLWRIGQTQRVQATIFRSAGTIETDAQAARLRMKELVLGATIGRDRGE